MHSYPRKTFLTILFAAACLNASSLFCQTTMTQAIEPGSTRVYITVSDKNNLPALFSESSLAVSIDKYPTQVLSLRQADSEKLVFAVLVDTSRSNYDHADAIRQAALQFFEGLSANDQQGYLITFDLAASATTKPIGASQAQKMLAALKFQGATALFEAIEATCETRLARAGNPSTPRRVVLLLSLRGGQL